MTVIIGIDIGLTGAIGAVDSRGTAYVRDLAAIPDGKGRRLCGRSLLMAVRELVPIGEPALVVFEDVKPRSMGNAGFATNSMHSQGSMMRSRGIVEGVVDITRLQFRAVQPQTWKRHFGLIGKPKDASLELARALFPLQAAQLKRQKDHNRAEAMLLARWAQEVLT